MLKRLPERVDPFRLAETGTHLEGCLELAEFERLCASLLACEGVVTGGLDFGIDEAGTRFLHGRLTAPVRMTCQRCLESMDYTLEADVQLALVRAQTQSVPEGYDPLLVEDDAPIRLLDVVEDELILALPLVPMHEQQVCPAMAILERQAAEEPAGERENPFAVLAGLKKDRNE